MKGRSPKLAWDVPASFSAKNTINPIRKIVDGLNLTPNKDKELIPLSIGDPTIYGNLKMSPSIEDAIIESLRSMKFNGYGPSVGIQSARSAVASYTSPKVEAKDVILTNGCSGALELCIYCLANAGQNILVPRPGFSLYKTLANARGIDVKFYNLVPEKSWEIDLDHLETMIDDNTAAIVIINPSNPCGSVFSISHIKDILKLVSQYKIPIIADEVYEHIVFHNQTYHSMASLSVDVPILSCGGIAKRFLVPGWRIGWIVIHDRVDVFKSEVYQGLVNLSQAILGPCTLIQGALPAILENLSNNCFEEVISLTEENANLCFNHLSKVTGLKPIMPQGALYMMVGIDIEHFPEFGNDLQFTEKLMEEQSVFCLPAMCFQFPNYFRIVLTPPSDKMKEAMLRLEEFCKIHFQENLGPADLVEQ